MEACLCCFAKQTGNLLCIRRYGGRYERISVPMICSLNAAYDFFAKDNMELDMIICKDDKYMWREYFGVIRFFFVTNMPFPSSWNQELSSLMDILSQALIFSCGTEHFQPVACLKNSITGSIGLIDAVIEKYLNCSFLSVGISSSLIPIAFSGESAGLNKILNLFSSEMEISYCGLLSANQFLGLSKPTADLTPRELFFINLLASNAENIVDRIVFLPHSSPSLGHKFYVHCLAPDIILVILAGSSFDFVSDRIFGIEKFWQNYSSIFTSFAIPKSYPSSVAEHIPTSIQGFITVDLVSHRFFASSDVGLTVANQAEERRMLLLKFYKEVVSIRHKNLQNMKPEIREVLQLVDDKRYYFLHDGSYLLFTFFEMSEPESTLKFLCVKILSALKSFLRYTDR